MSAQPHDAALAPAPRGRAATGASVLEVTDLTVTLARDGQPVDVVCALSLSIAGGRTLGLVGESGCGKTMTSLAIMGLVPAAGRVSGSIRLNGREMVSASERTWEDVRGSQASMVFQEPMSALNPVMPIGRQIAEVLVRHRSMRWREAHEQAIEMLAAVGIPAPRVRANDHAHQLSGGMRQRALIAIALACRPALLVADEPTTALDVTIQSQILDLMVELQDEIGMAIQFISHNLAVVSQVAHEIAVMYAGQIVERAGSQELFRSPLHPYTQGLIQTLPDPDRRVTRLAVITGRVASPSAHWVGCRFAPRCALADAHCKLVAPVLRDAGNGHWVSCHKAQA